MTAGKANTIVALIIFTIALIIYIMTVAPTLSFWDCGEFITCSYIMGIPHPPGSPLLSLLGRVFSLIPFHDYRGQGTNEIAYRINMIDVILGALTVMLTYLIMVKLIRKFRPSTFSKLENTIIIFCASITAFMVAFSDEFWANAVETETYMPTLFMQMLALWLTLRWEERKDDPAAVRYLFLAAYILGLGNGVHLAVVLIAPTVFLLVLFSRPDWFSNTKLWVYVVLFMSAGALIKLYAGLEIQYISMILFAIVAPLGIYILYQRGKDVWKLTLLGMILCGSLYIIGYSVYPTIMVRALKNPSINEGNPDNLNRYKLYMSRDQYGQENMYIGMFSRKADFSYQFGYMYVRYLIQQFPFWGPTFKVMFTNNRSPDSTEPVMTVNDVYISVFLLSILLYGFYMHGREDLKSFIALFLLFIASSIGLVLYLNMDNPQVRERSYFFLGSYHIIMVWIGMGILGIITDINDWLTTKHQSRLIIPVTLSLFIVFCTLPPQAVLSNNIDPNYTNFQVHDRTYDWIPWDYAYNILESCEKDAILFTNGDNDTFPLWYLQEVKGIRKDIRIVNLSLLNTDWYNLQMKKEGVTIPIKYSDEFIEKKLCGREETALTLRVWPLEGKKVTAAGITWRLPNYHKIALDSNEYIGLIRIQDVMVTNIIQWVNWTRPIYFAVTVALENKIGLDDYLSMEGMVFRLQQMPSKIAVNVDVMNRNIFEKYKYRSLTDTKVYKSPNTLKLITNYFIGFAQLCERYAAQGDRENTVRAAWAAINKTPNDLDKRLLLYQVFASNQMSDVIDEFIEWELENLNKGPDNYIKRLDFATKLFQVGVLQQAKHILEELISEDPTNIEAWKIYTAVLYSNHEYKQALDAVEKTLELAPDDQSIKEIRNILLQHIRENTSIDSTIQVKP
ncbi:MAG TPA: DUF2723 domain-containing protein [Anaerolineae bacterium]|nr:DUF2723 domain-containing protein [Anaerolineae bacterium]